jgi:hypothetical protein
VTQSDLKSVNQKENVGQATGEKKTHRGSRSRSANELRGPRRRSWRSTFPGAAGAEAGTAARSRFDAALISCRRIEGEMYGGI